MSSLLQRGGDALEMKKYSVLLHTRFKQGQKSIQDGPRSGCRKIIIGKLVKPYERQCLGAFTNMTRRTRPYSKDGLFITRSVSEKMDNIMKNYEVLVLCAPAYKYCDKTRIERRHNIKIMACSG